MPPFFGAPGCHALQQSDAFSEHAVNQEPAAAALDRDAKVLSGKQRWLA